MCMKAGDNMVNKEHFGESKNIEFKREIPGNHLKFLKDVIAFSNCTGGKIILGIEDKTNEVYGIGDCNPFKLSDDISNMVSDACTPVIEPDISIQTLEEKTILVIDIVPGKFRPYYIQSIGKDKSAFVRINGTSRQADARKLQELELEGQKISYDSIQEIGEEYNEKKALKLCADMKKIALSSCKTEEERLHIKDMTIEKLEDFGLLCRVGRDLYPTHAFMLMVDNKVKYAKIQCALFKGTTRDIFIDRKEFTGCIYEQIEEAYQFVLRHINLGAEINGVLRSDKYELPIMAIREMIANAVTHRSYLDDSCIQVCLFDDRLEVISPGMLYGGLDIETVKSGKSRCRNTAIAEAFQYMHIVEAWGTGIPRIIQNCKEYGMQEPLFEEFGDGVKVTLFRKVVNVSEKVVNTGGKVVNADKKVVNAFAEYEKLLEMASITKTFIKNMQTVFDNHVGGEPFGQADVRIWLACSKTKAANVIKAMKSAHIIEKVEGFGHGKYRFVELEDK